MRQFEVTIDNEIGSMAEICETLAKARVNIRAIATELRDTVGVIKFITDDEEMTRQSLNAAGFNFSEYEILPVKLMDRPGELAKLARALSNLNIDIESVFLLSRDNGTTEIAFKVNNLKNARELFK